MKRENYSYKLNVLHFFTNFILIENQWDRVKFLGARSEPKKLDNFYRKINSSKTSRSF